MTDEDARRTAQDATPDAADPGRRARPGRARDRDRHERRRAVDDRQRARGLRLVRHRQPAATAARRRWPTWPTRRPGGPACRGWPPSSTCAPAASSTTCRRRSTSCASAGWRPNLVFLDATDEAIVRRFESVRRPHPLQGDGPAARRDHPRARDAGRPAGQADVVIDTSGLNVHQLAKKVHPVFSGDVGPQGADRRDVVRLQVRRPARRRLRLRHALPAQPVLDPRAAQLHRAGRAGGRVRHGPGGRARVRRPGRRPDGPGDRPATSARGGATSPSRSAAPAASTARSPWPRRCGPGSAATTSRPSSCTATWGRSERAGERSRGRRARGRARPRRVARGAQAGLRRHHRRRHRRRQRRVVGPAARRVRRAAARRPADGADRPVRRHRVGPHLA